MEHSRLCLKEGRDKEKNERELVSALFILLEHVKPPESLHDPKKTNIFKEARGTNMKPHAALNFDPLAIT